MTMKHIAIAVLTLAASLPLSAQRRVVLADMDSRRSLPGANFITDRNERLVADGGGVVSCPQQWRSASVSCRGYLQRRVTAAEVPGDTIFLIPLEVTLAGVTVTAPHRSFDATAAVRSANKDAALMQPMVGFNPIGLLLTLLPKRHFFSHNEKLKKILDNY